MAELSLMGVFELRKRLGGISRQRVDQVTRQPGFPPPCATLGHGRLWLTEDIEDWIRTNRPNLPTHPTPDLP
jgi:predicted DNA-binding transcriptional regulator AlpA